MKNRPEKDMKPQNSREGHKMPTLSGGGGNLKGKLKNQRWLKKNGISLQALHGVKSQGSYNPHLIEKQRELHRNAKLIKKFKKSVKQQNPENSMLQVPVPEIDDTDIGLDEDVQRKQIQSADQERRKRKKNKTLQSVREEYEKLREEKEKAKTKREAIAKAKQEEKQRAAAKRKELKEKMFKKTRSGQPVMKFRIQHMLEDIIRNPDK